MTKVEITEHQHAIEFSVIAVNGMGDLIGSEKQVAWAKKIREDQINEFAAGVKKIVAKGNGMPDATIGHAINDADAINNIQVCLDKFLSTKSKNGETIAEIIANVAGNQSASYWIDNRSNTIMSRVISAGK